MDGVLDSSAFSDDQDDEPMLGKGCFYSYLRVLLLSDNFNRSTLTGNLVSHSPRKLAVTLCRRTGIHKDGINYRAR